MNLEQAKSVEISPGFQYMYNIFNIINIYFVQMTLSQCIMYIACNRDLIVRAYFVEAYSTNHVYLHRPNAGCVLRFKRKRKITNAKIYEDKRDLYCIIIGVGTGDSVNCCTTQISLGKCLALTKAFGQC